MTDEQIRAFAFRHGLTNEQAIIVLNDHGEDESRWSETVRNMVHFLKAPS